MIFTTSADKIVRKKTIAVFFIFTIFPMSGFLSSSDRWTWFAGFFSFFMLLLLYTYLHKPLKYEVDNNDLIIHRLIGNVKIHIREITRVDRIHHDLLKNSNKGGAFGYMGKFDTDLGKLTFYATRRDKLVLLTKTDSTKVILTPDQQDEFIEALEKKISTQQLALQNAG